MNQSQQQANIIEDVDGRRYIELGYDCYAELIGENALTDGSQDNRVVEKQQIEPNADSSEVKQHVKNELKAINTKLDVIEGKINKRLDVIECKTDKILLFMANVEKFMSLKKSGTTPEQKVKHECFTVFADLCPVQDESKLALLENNLCDRQYADKLYRFFHTEYNLNGKREGSPFFKILMRRMLVPTILQPFSWKGFSRKVPGPECTADNRSFKETFPGFVAFIQRIVSAADIEHTMETNDAYFSQFLRQKNVEVQRFLEGKQGRQANSTRQVKSRNIENAERPDSAAGLVDVQIQSSADVMNE